MDTILATKQKMSQTFVQGTRVPVTLAKAGPCIVTQVKTKEKDGYNAVQLGLGEKRIKNIKKPVQGHLRGVTKDKKAPRFLREVKETDSSKHKTGDVVRVGDVLKRGDMVQVTGTSKGKGFAGVMKRWGFAGGPRTHGQSDRLRSPGSIGQGTTPGRVHKGKKMPGRMGDEQVTVKNLIITNINEKDNEIEISGPIPGIPGNLIIIKRTGSGKLSELVQDVPTAQIQEGEEEVEGESEEVKEEVKE